jgi:spore coat polysaccharide biosynthesis protein SpsF
LPYGIGDDDDVLGRILSSLVNINCTDVFRVTTESPYTDLTQIGEIWKKHVSHEFDASFYDNIIDGCGFEIITKEALEISHAKGSKRHRSEMCTLFIRENTSDFRVNRINAPEELNRRDLRLTVDYPEDLIVCRAIFEYFDLNKNMYSLPKIIKFLENNPSLVDLIRPYSDAGYETMYL